MKWRRTVVAAAAAMLWLGATAAALAGGFEHPTNGTRALGRGGAFTAMANDLTALEYNPAGLLHNRGTHLMLSNNVTDFRMRFVPTGPDGAPLPAEANNAGPFLLAPVLGASTDIIHPDLRIALGVFGPSAYGRSSYDVRGAQRYMLTEMDVMIANYTVAVAWQPYKELGIGLSLHWIDMMQAKMGMVVNGSWLGIEYTNESYDVEANLSVSDHINFAGTLGAWAMPIDRLRLGASLRFPIDSGFATNLDAEGTVALEFQGTDIKNFYESGLEGDGLALFNKDGDQTETLPVTFSMKLPMVARLGIQYIHPLTADEQLFDIELDVIWEGWSVLDHYSVDMAGYMKVIGKGVMGEGEELWFNSVRVPKKSRDTWSVRVGGDVRVAEWVQLRLGGYFETGSVPMAYTNIDFASFDRFGLGTGVTFHYRWFDLSFAWSHIFQQDRVVSREDAQVYIQFPVIDDTPLDEHKVNVGKFVTSFDIYSLSLEAKF